MSQYENIELAEQMLSELCEAEGVNGEVRYWVGMALREALANAIKHGNQLNPDRRVHLEIRVDAPRELVLVVEDEGDGFDPVSLADPTDANNLLRSSGRGVYYMRHFMDEVRFQSGAQGGTRIELTKKLGGRDEEPHS